MAQPSPVGLQAAISAYIRSKQFYPRPDPKLDTPDLNAVAFPNYNP